MDLGVEISSILRKISKSMSGSSNNNALKDLDRQIGRKGLTGRRLIYTVT